MPKRKKTKHHQIKLTLRNNSEIEVDHDIHELIEIMNAPGLVTLNSCQDDHGTSYIQFRGKKSKLLHVLPANPIAKRKTQQTPTPHLIRKSNKSEIPKQFSDSVESHRL